MISVAVIVLIILMAIFAPVIAAIIGHGPNEQFPAPIGVNAQGQPVGPSTTFWLGTDTLGRDVLVRIAYGARISLIVGFVATIITVVIGASAGLAAAYFGGLVDSLPGPADGLAARHPLPAARDLPRHRHRPRPEPS